MWTSFSSFFINKIFLYKKNTVFYVMCTLLLCCYILFFWHNLNLLYLGRIPSLRHVELNSIDHFIKFTVHPYDPPNSNQSSIQITSNIQANGSTQPTSINIMPHSSINSTNELTLISPALQNNINNVIRSARQKMGGSQLPPSPTLPTCQH